MGRTSLFLAFVVMAPGSSACSTIKPQTTAAAPAGPYVAADNEAVVVLHRRSQEGPDARGYDLGIRERWSYVRVYDASGKALADLRATEHAVVRLPPGPHHFFAKNWSAEPKAGCVAALQGDLEGGRVYAVEMESQPRDTRLGCNPLQFIAIPRSGLEAFFRQLATAHSEQRTFLGESRETSILLDNATVVSGVIHTGEERLAQHPVVLADGIAWTAESSSR